MPTKERAVDRGVRTARHDLRTIGTEIRTARIAAGLSQRSVAEACGISHTQVGRIERAVLASISVVQLARVGAAVGLDVRIRAYPGPAPIRDVAQVALMRRCRALLPASATLRLEVPIPIDGDQRAWDGAIAGLVDGPRAPLPVEAETVLYDLQAQIRRLQLKLRDGRSDHVLLLVLDSRRNRRIVREAWPILANIFPISPRRALAALAEGRHPGGSALVFL